MPEIDESVGNDAYGYQDIGELVVLCSRELEQHGAQNYQRKRKNTLDQNRLPDPRHYRLHDGICLNEQSACEQRLCADPVSEVQKV